MADILMKWFNPEKNIAWYRASGKNKDYDVKQYFLLDMQWVLEIIKDKKIIRIPAMFNRASKAKKIAELIEKE